MIAVPLHVVFGPLIDATGSEFTVKARVAVAEQPFASVTVTVYVPAVLTVIAAVVCAPALHKYDTPPVAVNTLDPPAQIVWLPLIDAVGNGFTVNVRLAVAVQPPGKVTVTVYVPAVATVMAAVVCAPALQT